MLKNSIISSVLALALIGCNGSDEPQSYADDIAEIQLSDVPAAISNLVLATSPDFQMTEVLKKRREGRVYYDVEGELPNGDEIEFDILMMETGPKIVEIQRDIAWATTPQPVKNVVAKANSNALEIARVIESKQADSDTIIYEVFVVGHTAKPRFEVSVSKDTLPQLLDTPWKH